MQTLYTPELKNSPIFVVDDEPVTLKLIERILESGGFEDVYTIQNSEDVLPRYLEMRPNLILLDINMPRLDGFGFIEGVRRNDKYRAIPILVLTTESDAEKKNRARQAGATGWIVKPFDPTKLIDAIERVTA